ncbi:MAG: hypothetical protein ACKVQQ_03255 [Burkholderiales bacterium]
MTNFSLPERPEQTFFTDPALDRAFGFILALANEVYVLRDRQAVLEKALTAAGVINQTALTAAPSADEERDLARDRDAFIEHLFQNLRGLQVSRGA